MKEKSKISNRVFLISCLAAAALLAACNSEKPAADDKAFSQSAPKMAANSDQPIPPKDAQFTIYCQQFNGPNHIAEAMQARQILSTSTPLKKKWYLVHGSDQSTLYYGYYRTFNTTDVQDADEAKRAIADLDAIRMIQDSQGVRPFSASLPVLIDSPDPDANPAWDLSKAKGYWSVEIGAFNAPTQREPGGPMIDRKQAAVEAVREARKQGIEAYYYHGDTVSSVCVGVWPQEAVIESNGDENNVNPDAPLLVTPQPLSDDYKKQLGQNIQTSAPTYDVVDPTLHEALTKWDEHDVNGQGVMKPGIDPVTKAQVQVLERSYLVKITHADNTAAADSGAPTVATPDDALINPVAPPPGAGQLRSLGQ